MNVGKTTMQSLTIEFRSLGKSDQLRENNVNPYYVDDLKCRVSVARVRGKLYAFNDLCTHEGCQLSAGRLTGTTLMCPCHGSQFDIVSGAVVRGPAKQSLTTYQVRERDGEIEVQV
jgi:3-phenylpropionate/trans-cinnamate dioxygenase ferredoxin component